MEAVRTTLMVFLIFYPRLSCGKSTQIQENLPSSTDQTLKKTINDEYLAHQLFERTFHSAYLKVHTSLAEKRRKHFKDILNNKRDQFGLLGSHAFTDEKQRYHLSIPHNFTIKENPYAVDVSRVEKNIDHLLSRPPQLGFIENMSGINVDGDNTQGIQSVPNAENNLSTNMHQESLGSDRPNSKFAGFNGKCCHSEGNIDGGLESDRPDFEKQNQGTMEASHGPPSVGNHENNLESHQSNNFENHNDVSAQGFSTNPGLKYDSQYEASHAARPRLENDESTVDYNAVHPGNEHDTHIEESHMPHPAVQHAHALETDVNKLLANAATMHMESVQLNTKAKELENQAEVLHAHAGGPLVHPMKRPIAVSELPSDARKEPIGFNSGENAKPSLIANDLKNGALNYSPDDHPQVEEPSDVKEFAADSSKSPISIAKESEETHAAESRHGNVDIPSTHNEHLTSVNHDAKSNSKCEEAFDNFKPNIPEDLSDGLSSDHLKSGYHGQGPERGGQALSRPVVNGQYTNGGHHNAPDIPPLGEPTYEHNAPIHDINTGYPIYHIPPKSGEIAIPEYHKPPPPLYGTNPYEVLTSSELNGTSYKTNDYNPAAMPINHIAGTYKGEVTSINDSPSIYNGDQRPINQEVAALKDKSKQFSHPLTSNNNPLRPEAASYKTPSTLKYLVSIKNIKNIAGDTEKAVKKSAKNNRDSDSGKRHMKISNVKPSANAKLTEAKKLKKIISENANVRVYLGYGPYRGGPVQIAPSHLGAINTNIVPNLPNQQIPPAINNGGSSSIPVNQPIGVSTTFQKVTPIVQVDTGYPVYNIPHETEVAIPEYHKPLPPLHGVNPYEVLTSAELNGTEYKTEEYNPERLPTRFSPEHIPAQRDQISLESWKLNNNHLVTSVNDYIKVKKQSSKENLYRNRITKIRGKYKKHHRKKKKRSKRNEKKMKGKKLTLHIFKLIDDVEYKNKTRSE